MKINQMWVNIPYPMFMKWQRDVCCFGEGQLLCQDTSESIELASSQLDGDSNYARANVFGGEIEKLR